jgi:uncharacterized OB-fold protein
MLRNTHESWWRRMFATNELVPAYARAEAARRCPECSASYAPRDRYCPRCHAATPEWRYG